MGIGRGEGRGRLRRRREGEGEHLAKAGEQNDWLPARWSKVPFAVLLAELVTLKKR